MSVFTGEASSMPEEKPEENLPGASGFWVDHPADHTLPGLILLFGEWSLRGESSFLLICHHYTEKNKQNQNTLIQ